MFVLRNVRHGFCSDSPWVMPVMFDHSQALGLVTRNVTGLIFHQGPLHHTCIQSDPVQTSLNCIEFASRCLFGTLWTVIFSADVHLILMPSRGPLVKAPVHPPPFFAFCGCFHKNPCNPRALWALLASVMIERLQAVAPAGCGDCGCAASAAAHATAATLSELSC